MCSQHQIIRIHHVLNFLSTVETWMCSASTWGLKFQSLTSLTSSNRNDTQDEVELIVLVFILRIINHSICWRVCKHPFNNAELVYFMKSRSRDLLLSPISHFLRICFYLYFVLLNGWLSKNHNINIFMWQNNILIYCFVWPPVD